MWPMSRGRPKAALVLTTAARATLEHLAEAATPRVGVAKRAKIVLLCAEGLDNYEVARRVGASAHTVARWRAQFLMAGVHGLQDAPSRGGRRPISNELLDEVVAIALEPISPGLPRMSTRQVAEVAGLSHNSVHQIWRSFGIRPHRTTAFNLSVDSRPINKHLEVIGLYLAPPAHVLVVCIDEESEVEGMNEDLPSPPRRPRKSTREILDSDGTDNYFMSEIVEIIASTVVVDQSSREVAARYREFLDRIEATALANMDVHLVVDNYNAHKASEIREWMAKRSRFRLHFAPTHDSWLDQVQSLV